MASSERYWKYALHSLGSFPESLHAIMDHDGDYTNGDGNHRHRDENGPHAARSIVYDAANHEPRILRRFNFFVHFIHLLSMAKFCFQFQVAECPRAADW